MGELSYFLKENKVKRENLKIAVTKSIVDENGVPVEWEFRALTTAEDEQLKESFIKETKDKKGRVYHNVDRAAYFPAALARSCVYPNLNNAELQDSYGVRTAEDLLKKLVDLPGEYSKLVEEFAKYNGFDSEGADIEEAKN